MWLGVSVTFDLMSISLRVVHGGCGEDGPRGAGRPETCEVIRQKLVINPPGCDDEDVRFPVVRQRLRDCKSTTAAAVNTQSGNTMDNHRNRDSAETEVQVGSPDLQVRVTVIGPSLHKDDDIGAVSIFNLNADLAKDPTEVPEDEIKKDGLALGVWRKAVRSASV